MFHLTVGFFHLFLYQFAVHYKIRKVNEKFSVASVDLVPLLLMHVFNLSAFAFNLNCNLSLAVNFQVPTISVILSKYLNRPLKFHREPAAAALSEFVRYRYVWNVMSSETPYDVFPPLSLYLSHFVCFILFSLGIVRDDCR